MNARKLFYVLLLASLITVSFGSVQPAKAEDSIGLVDQSNVSPAHGFISIQFASPVGQSFTPGLPGLDVVELWTRDFAYGTGYGAQLVVNIRESTIYGPILGTSDILQLPDGFDGVSHFTFPSVVPLTPGQKYVIELVVLPGEPWYTHNWGIGSSGGPYSTYPGGDWIAYGIEFSNNDMWFREGFANPTPPSAKACMKDGWVNFIRSDGSSFKNQGDCIQYFYTGK